MTLIDKSQRKTARTDTYYITVLKCYHKVIHTVMVKLKYISADSASHVSSEVET